MTKDRVTPVHHCRMVWNATHSPDLDPPSMGGIIIMGMRPSVNHCSMFTHAAHFLV